MTSAAGRMLVIIGSGETSPTMVTVHKDVISRMPGPADAVLLDTPYRFQENAADVSARARAYFAGSVGIDVDLLPEVEGNGETGQRALARLRTAGWVFAGPGSPSYALRRWHAAAMGEVLRERVAAGTGVTVLASAAAATAGLVALPVYEIYKAGADPHWLPGLDLLAAAGLSVAVIPHYDNAEGGTHDTRFCYLGARRLEMLDRELPDEAAILGVDEHTAVLLDLTADSVEVRGRGGLTVRKGGSSEVLAAPARVPGAALRAMVRTGARAPRSGPLTVTPEAAPPVPLPDIVRNTERQFAAARLAGDGVGMAAAVLELEAAISGWRADTDEDQGAAQARTVLRALIAQLGAAATGGLREPADVLGPAVAPLLALRAALRAQRRYGEADAIRNALAAAGVNVRDERAGQNWSLAGSAPSAAVRTGGDGRQRRWLDPQDGGGPSR